MATSFKVIKEKNKPSGPIQVLCFATGSSFTGAVNNMNCVKCEMTQREFYLLQRC